MVKQASWNVMSDIDWELFSTGEPLTFVRATHDTSDQTNGFRFSVSGLLDPQGRFHVISHETSLPEKEDPFKEAK
jgi:hypothetical protein